MAKTKLVYITYAPTSGVAGSKYFLASDTLYTATNAADTGITPAPEGTKRGRTPLYDTGELMKSGYLDRISVTIAGGTGKPPTQVRMFVTPDKRQGLIDKFNGSSAGTVNGKAVLGASAGTRRLVNKV